MPENSLGYAWLKDHFKLREYHLTHTSSVGTRLRKEIDENGNVTETYPPHYIPGDNPLDHVEFALKYDDLSLDFLKTVFTRVNLEELKESINKKPKAAYQRRIGFLYEFLTGIEIPVHNQPKTNYINLLDEEKYITGKIIKNQRWLINDNLLGTPDFCPVIRKTIHLQNILKEDFKKLVEKVTHSFPPDIFHRAVNYLYTKETRSSYQIEKEKPTPEHVGRFVRLLEKAGEQPLRELLSEVQLTALQNEIVDPRYAAASFRHFQNYIGQTTLNYKQIVHYVCPPPQFVNSLMNGLLTSVEKMEESPAAIRATVAAFAFVFIHPFEDGNGRLHRFLIHDMLTRGGVVPKGMIIPVSAHMVNHIKEYDTALESYSKPLLIRVRYEMDEEQKMTVNNPEEVEGYFRYPDLTNHSVYLGRTIKGTIEEDIYWEMEFLVNYDEVKAAIRNIVDMPDKKIDLIIKIVHQNKGTFPNRRRNQFEELSDDEISKMQTAFREIFNIPVVDRPPAG
jgi:hypothetical protein